MNKAYNRINWENYPSIQTPLNKYNLDKEDVALDEIDNRVISLDTRKFDKSEAQLLIKNITFDLQTGILKKYYYNGSTEEINTGISKLNMNLRFDKESQILYIVNADGTEDPVDLSVFITNYEFGDSDTIAHNVSSDGTVTSIVKDGSITEDKLQPNYLADVKVETAKAEASATSAAQSETNAKNSYTAAKKSQTAAKTSETNAKTSETNAAASETAAGQSATSAASSAAAAKTSETNAKTSETNAKKSETNAATSKNSAANSATTAAAKASDAVNSAGLSQSYAVGTGGTVRENDDTDCSEYYYEQAKRISQSLSGVLPMGTITFEGLANAANQKAGYLFNISDSFTSDDRFADGGGIFYGAGSNVLYTADGKWDVLAAAMVTGVKGNLEKEYRQGMVNLTPSNIGAFPGLTTVKEKDTDLNDYLSAGMFYFSSAYVPENIPIGVNGILIVIPPTSSLVKQIWLGLGTTNSNDYMTYIRNVSATNPGNWKRFAMSDELTPDNIGALSLTGDSKDNTVTFTSNDVANVPSATAWTNVSKIDSGEKHSSLFNKIATMFKNVRFLYNLLGSQKLTSLVSGIDTSTGQIVESTTTDAMGFRITQAISTHDSAIESIAQKTLELNTGFAAVGQMINVSTDAQTIPAMAKNVEIGRITLPAGFWIIHATVWYGVYNRTMRINGYEILNRDHKPELIAFYNGPGGTLPLIIDSWENEAVEIGPGSIVAFRIR